MLKEIRKMWYDTLAPNGKYGFNRMLSFTTFWPLLGLCITGFFRYETIRLEILFLMASIVLGSKIVNSFDKVKGTTHVPPSDNSNP